MIRGKCRSCGRREIFVNDDRLCIDCRMKDANR